MVFISRIRRVAVVVAVSLPASVAIAQSAENPIALLDRMALALTGLPAAPADVDAYLNQGQSLAAIADSMRTRPEFERRLSEYWLHVLGITAPVRFDDIIDRGVGRSVATSLNNNIKTVAEGGGGGVTTNFCTNLLVPGSTTVRQRPIGTVNQLYRLNVPATHPQFNELANCACNDNNNQPIPDVPRAEIVNPAWAPSQQVLACPGVKNYCGSDLGKCFPTTFRTDASHHAPVYEPLQRALTIEPGVMIAKIVAEDKPWDDVLRGTRRLVNGPLASFLRTYGKPFLDASPPSTYGDITQGPVASLAKTEEAFHWVEGSNLNAGIISTVGFQRSTNGWRAKAARTMKAFLCREFAVPDGVAQVPSAESELTRKPYCQSCHVVLEPVSQLFGRWATLGDTNYFYNEATGVSAVGEYGGVVDADTTGLARIFTNTSDFNECAVRRAFAFVVGRPMSTAEADLMLEPLVATFLDSKKVMWPVMKQILASPAFTGVNP